MKNTDISLVNQGASQQDVFNALKSSNSNLMLPITGSSPHSSIIGNALSQGYGNGRSTVRIEDFIQVNGFTNDLNFVEGIKFGTTKYEANSSLNQLVRDPEAIITQAKIALPTISNHMLLVAFSLDNSNQIPATLQKLIELKNDGIIEGNWSLFTAHRLIAERTRKSDYNLPDFESISFDQAKSILNEDLKYSTWNGAYNGTFCCYFPNLEMLNACEEYISNQLSPVVTNLSFISCTKEEVIKRTK